MSKHVKRVQKTLRHVWERFRKVTLTDDHKRNLRVLVFASILNLSFALEKLLLCFDIYWGNFAWFCIYGGLALWTSWLATKDYVFDVVEHKHNDTERLL